MKISKVLTCIVALCVSLTFLGCAPSLEESAVPAVEKVFSSKGKVAKCIKIVNLEPIKEKSFHYKARALVAQNGTHSYYTVVIEKIGGDTLVSVDWSSRADIN